MSFRARFFAFLLFASVPSSASPEVIQMLTLHWNEYAETYPSLGNLRAALQGLDPFEAAMAENVFNEVRVVHQSAPFPEIPR